MDDDKFDKLFVGWFIFCALLSLAILGLGAWGFIEVILWIKTK